MTVQQFVSLIHQWRRDYHTTSKDEVVFQCAPLLSNVFFTNNSMHAMQKHPAGAEKLPDTIQRPAEVWSKWADPDTQQQVQRAYIGDGYVVLTLDGKVMDAMRVPPSALDKYRKGVPLL